MGSAGHLVVNGGAPELLPRAQALLGQLESLWSRFQPDSELCRLNSSQGRWVQVCAPTLRVVQAAVRAWEVTGGLFDPTVLPALKTAGYSGSFETLSDGLVSDTRPVPAPGCADIEFQADRIYLPPGIELDLGGIGKGYAADLLVNELLTAGAEGASVNLGGDVRMAGSPPSGVAWDSAVADEADPDTDLAWLALADGAVATSTRLRRRWQRQGRELHHLIDPRTGMPATSEVATVTVVAGDASWAEVLAKAALIAGMSAGTTLLESHGVAGVLVTGDGAAHPVGNWERYVTWTPESGGTSRASAD